MRLAYKLTEAQHSALYWAIRLPEGIRPTTVACSHLSTLLVLERMKLVEVIERDAAGRPTRAVVTNLGRRVGSSLVTWGELQAQAQQQT